MGINSYNITYPIQDDNVTNGFLSMNSVTKDVYSSNLLLLLTTQRGERYYEPDYGTNLLKYIFEPNDNLTATDVEQEIKNTVSLYLPDITIKSVIFNWLNDADGNSISDSQLNVNIQFLYSEGALNDAGSIDLNF